MRQHVQSGGLGALALYCRDGGVHVVHSLARLLQLVQRFVRLDCADSAPRDYLPVVRPSDDVGDIRLDRGRDLCITGAEADQRHVLAMDLAQ